MPGQGERWCWEGVVEGGWGWGTPQSAQTQKLPYIHGYQVETSLQTLPPGASLTWEK